MWGKEKLPGLSDIMKMVKSVFLAPVLPSPPPSYNPFTTTSLSLHYPDMSFPIAEYTLIKILK